MPDEAAPLPPAEIEHRLAGRMRLRLRAKRGDAEFFRRLEAGLARIPGVRSVRASATTGGVLIEHGGDDAGILSAAKEQALFEAAPPARPPAPFTGTAAELPGSLDLAVAGLAGAGLLQLARGKIVGSASENLWNAYSLHAITKESRLAVLLVAFGLLQIVRGEVLGSATSLFLYALSARQIAQRQAAEGGV